MLMDQLYGATMNEKLLQLLQITEQQIELMEEEALLELLAEVRKVYPKLAVRSQLSGKISF